MLSLFKIGLKEDKCKLEKVGAVSGPAGDSLTYSVSNEFSTYDQDNDNWKAGSCGMKYGATYVGHVTPHAPSNLHISGSRAAQRPTPTVTITNMERSAEMRFQDWSGRLGRAIITVTMMVKDHKIRLTELTKRLRKSK